MIGAKNPTEQLSKAIVGASTMAATMMLVGAGRTTWAAPTDEKKKQAFYAAGLQPYSLKIGDKWFAYNKLPPALGFNIAFVAALNDAYENQLITENTLDSVLDATSKYNGYFTDQSYMKSIADLVGMVKGEKGGTERLVSNNLQQLVPYRALLGWMARLTDPYQRQVDYDAGFIDQQVQQLFSQLPFLSQTVPARTDEFGEPVPAQSPMLNAFSPIRVSTENPEKKEIYDIYKEQTLMRRNKDAIRASLEKGVIPDTLAAQAAEGQPIQDPRVKLREEAMISMIKDKLEFGQVLNPQETELYTQLPQEPQLSDKPEIDSLLLTKYDSALTTSRNKVVELYEAGQLSEEQVLSKIEEIEATKDMIDGAQKVLKAKMGSGKAKKPKKVSIKFTQVKTPKVTIRKASKAPTLKLKKTPTFKISQPKTKTLKLSTGSVKVFRPKPFRNTLTG